MDVWEVDAVARGLYERARLDPAEPASPVALARALLGADAVRVVPFAALPGDGKLTRLRDRWLIFVRPKLPRHRLHFVVAHELAEYALRGLVDPDIERACNAVAAAILVPHGAFARALREDGEDIRALAERFRTTQTCVALRLGEVTDRPLVALSRSHMWIRGREWGWPPEPALRRLIRGDLPPGVLRHVLTDAPKRVVLVGDDVD